MIGEVFVVCDPVSDTAGANQWQVSQIDSTICLLTTLKATQQEYSGVRDPSGHARQHVITIALGI